MDATTIGLIATVVGALATAISVAVAWYSVALSRRSAAEQQRLAERATAAAAEQTRLAALTTAADWLHALRDWANDTVDALSEAEHGCGADADPGALQRCLARLSALADRGRFFFPNILPAGDGTQPGSAYGGLRHPALDPVILVYRVLAGSLTLDPAVSRAAVLREARRVFVSLIQQILGPGYYNETVARMLQQAGAARQGDPTLGGLLPGNIIPYGEVALLRIIERKLSPPAADGGVAHSTAPIDARDRN